SSRRAAPRADPRPPPRGPAPAPRGRSPPPSTLPPRRSGKAPTPSGSSVSSSQRLLVERHAGSRDEQGAAGTTPRPSAPSPFQHRLHPPDLRPLVRVHVHRQAEDRRVQIGR